MAEQAPAIQSKRLLVVALILAGVVVFIYNVHVNQVRKAGRGKMIQLLKFRRDMDSGEEEEVDLSAEALVRRIEGG